MLLKVKKIYHGKVEIRDYQIKRALENRENILIEFGDEKMTVLYQDLDKGVPTRKQVSYFNNSVYTLVAFPWKPEKKVPEGQLTLI